MASTLDAALQGVADLVPAKSFTLTTSSNTGTLFTGGAGNDYFDGSFSSSGAQTLNTGDSLHGGAGTDTVTAEIKSSVTPVLLDSIEVVDLITTAAAIVDLSNAASLKNVNNIGATAGLTLQGVSKAATVGIQDTSTAGQVITFNDVTGTADTASVALRNVTGATTLQVDGVETLNIASNGSANTIATLTAAQATKLVITGDKALTITTNAATVATIDASAATGAVTATVTPGAASVTGGAGKDVFTLAGTGTATAIGGAGDDKLIFGTTFDALDTVTGGDGTDTLTVDVDTVDAAAISTALTLVTGVETLALNGFADVSTVNVANISSGINRVNLDAASGGFNNTINMSAGANTLGINIAAAVAAGQTLIVDAAGTGTTDSLAIVNMRTATDDIGSTTSNITTTDFETVSINTGTYTTAVAQNLGVLSTGTAAVTVTGSNNLVLAAGFVGASLDASGMTGSAILSMGAATTVTTITGTANNDVLVGDAASTINGGAGNDTITGGTGIDTLNGDAGNDTITTGGGVDNVNAGAGNDTVVATLAQNNVMVGGDGTDILSLAVAATAATATGVSGFETLTATGAITQDMAVFLDNTTFTAINASNVGTVAITNASNSITTLTETVAGTATFARLIDTSANSLNVNVTGGVTATAITADNEETINLASTNASAITVTTLTDADLTTLNITGAGAVTITTLAANTTTAGTTLTINGSTNTGGISVSAVNSTIVANMTGSATAANTLVGSAGSDTITGGSAADNITGGVGYDTLTGGTGADTFVFANTATGTPSATLFDTITDYASGSDVIDFGAITLLQSPNSGVAAAGHASVTSGVVSFHISDNTLALRLLAVEDAISENTNGTTGDAAAGDALIFAFGTDSYLFVSDGTAGVGATDVLIKLTGITGTSADSLTISGGDITGLA